MKFGILIIDIFINFYEFSWFWRL